MLYEAREQFKDLLQLALTMVFKVRWSYRHFIIESLSQ